MNDIAMFVRAHMAPNVLVKVDGHVDGTGFKRCKGDSLCNLESNGALKLRRANDVKNGLVAREIPAGRIIPVGGESFVARGAEFRGVTVYVITITAPASIPSGVSQASFDSLARAVAANSKENQKLQAEVDSLKARPTMTVVQAPKETETIKVPVAPIVEVDIGLGAVAWMSDTFDIFTPTIQAEIRPRGSPVSLRGVGGYRPFGADDPLCRKRKDWFGSLALRYQIVQSVGISGGVFAAPETCREGGPRLDGAWLTMVDAGRFVEIDVTPPGNRFKVMGFQPFAAIGATKGTLKIVKDSTTIDSYANGGMFFRLGVTTTNLRKPRR